MCICRKVQRGDNLVMEFTKDFCKKDIFDLWQSTFGDSKEYIEYVYNVFEKHGRFYGLSNGKTLVSMMLVLDLPLNFFGKTQKSAYMYACATQEKYKGKGYFSALYKMAKDDLSKDGYENIYCVPESEKLFGMYNKLGLDKCLYRSETKVNFDNKEPETYFEQSDDFDKAYDLYCKGCDKLDGFCQKSKDIFECAIQSADAKFYFFDGGYFCYDQTAVNEFLCFDKDAEKRVLCDIARFLKKDITVFSKPYNNMCKYVALEKLRESDFCDGAYANMLFD